MRSNYKKEESKAQHSRSKQNKALNADVEIQTRSTNEDHTEESKAHSVFEAQLARADHTQKRQKEGEKNIN